MQAELNWFEKSIEHLSSEQIKSLYQNIQKDPKNTDMNTNKLIILGRRNLLLIKSRSLPYSVRDLPLVKKTQPRLLQSYYVAKPVSNERVKSALALIQESSLCLSISAERPEAPFALRAFRAPLALQALALRAPEAAPLALRAPEVAPLALQAPEAPTALSVSTPLALRAPEVASTPLALQAFQAPSESLRFLMFLLFFLLLLTVFWFADDSHGPTGQSRIIEIATNNINKNL